MSSLSQLQVVPLFDSLLKSVNNGASKQLPNDLKTTIVQHHGLGEGYKKLSQRFQLSVSTVRNIVRKRRTTGTVLVKARSGRPRQILERQRWRIVRTVKDNPQTTSRDLQHHLAADGITVHRSTIKHTFHKEKLCRRVMWKKPFLHTHHQQSRLRYAKARLDKPASYWNKVPWTDEIKLFCQNKGCYAWRW